ncbi:MAG: lysylphosphatidylglycerol synthase transmembrane domain-containing protein [Acidimicrobiales bacterium]
MTDAGEDPQVQKPNRKRAIITIGIALVVVVIVFGVIFPQLVDWDLVLEAIRGLETVDIVIIVALGLVRYVPAGWIYSLVLPGLSLWRGIRAWVATTGVGSTLPGFDLVLRLGMYNSWGFPIERATSGMFLSGIVEMSTKLALAVLAVGVWAVFTFDDDLLIVAIIGAAVLGGAGMLVAGVLRSEERARSFGRLVERMVKWGYSKFARQAPADLVDRILDVRIEAREVLGRRWPQAFLAAGLAQATVFALLLYSLRAVGVDSDVLAWQQILLAQALVTLITTIPITPGSVGVAELVFVAIFSAMAGDEHRELITAGVVVYRLALWLLPIPIGWAVALRWQSTSGQRLFGSR